LRWALISSVREDYEKKWGLGLQIAIGLASSSMDGITERDASKWFQRFPN